MKDPRYITTGAAAKLVGVCPKTVHNWYVRGLVIGYCLPGNVNKHVRINLASLRELLANAGAPTDSIDKLIATETE